MRFQFNHTMNGYTKPYFTDDTGRLFRDETGNLDNFDSIPMEIDGGRSNMGTDQTKVYHSVLVNSENARGAILKYAIDGGNFETLGQITNPVQKFEWPQGGQLIEGRDVDYKVSHNSPGDPPVVNGYTTFYSVSEAVPNEVS